MREATAPIAQNPQFQMRQHAALSKARGDRRRRDREQILAHTAHTGGARVGLRHATQAGGQHGPEEKVSLAQQAQEGGQVLERAREAQSVKQV